MRSNSGLVRASAVIAMAAAAASGRAETLSERLQACTAQTDAAQRLSCFDGVAAGLPSKVRKQTSTSPAAANPAEPARGASAAADTAEFGVDNGPMQARRQSSRPQAMAAVVARVVTLPYDRRMVTLDNGQVWRQLESVEYFPLKAGDTVHISVGAMGSYVLSAPSKRSTKVTRVN